MLELAGNAWPDLAGCLLTFTNRLSPVQQPHLTSFDLLQRGSIGDLTASRKVRVFDVPNHEAFDMIDRGEKPPEHLANCLYLEWFSERNGRVVIESTDYELTISAPEWRLTKEEDEHRARDAAAGLGGFMQTLTDAIEQQQRGQKDPEEKWDEHDYEKFLKESDARTNKYLELQEKYGDADEAEEKIAQEMGWNRELTPEEAELESQRIEEINAACEEALNEPPPDPDPQREGIDWIRTEEGEIRHPLQHRCFESAMKLWHECDVLGLEKSADQDFANFVFEFQTTGVKLAGALDGIAEGTGPHDGAFTVAYLKRALSHLHKAQAAGEAVAKKKLVPADLVAQTRQEMFEIREGILRLMEEFRSR